MHNPAVYTAHRVTICVAQVNDAYILTMTSVTDNLDSM